MNNEPLQDQDVIRLLEALKNQETPYPAALMEQQRAAFKKSAALLGASVVVWSLFGLKGTVKVAVLENLLKWVLIGALAVQVAVGGYIYRDQIRQLFMTPTPPVIEPLGPILQPYATAIHENAALPSNTPAPEETSLPSPTARATQTPAPTFNPNSVVEPSFTPAPTLPGNRLGQTPTPPGKRDTATPAPTKTPKP